MNSWESMLSYRYIEGEVWRIWFVEANCRGRSNLEETSASDHLLRPRPHSCAAPGPGLALSSLCH